MAERKTARQIEMDAAATPPSRTSRTSPLTGEAAAMLGRRGLQPRATRLELPFSDDIDEQAAAQLSQLLGHYAFRLFLRGAIQKAEGFTAEDACAYVKGARASAFANALVELGMASLLTDGRYRLAHVVTSFGPTLEWYVARELARRFQFSVAAGVKFRARGIGGDLDVVAAAEGKLVYLELKSSPPKHLAEAEVRAFFNRIHLLRPDITLFVMDTALRLSDKVVPMLVTELRRRSGNDLATPHRIERELWALTPHLYVVNSRPEIMRNVGRAIAEGLKALAPPAP